MSFAAIHSHKISQNEAISLARQGMGLPMSTLSKSQKIHNINDAVFVSIDFENISNLAQDPDRLGLKTQMGVCILDSRQIGTAPTESILQNHNFTTGNWQYRDEKFIFGQTQHTTVRELTSKLESLIDRKRNIIFIAHDDNSEITILKKLGFDLNTGISGFIDTQKIMKEVCIEEKGYKIYRNYSLYDLLDHLDIQNHSLHVGGNDAHFTMKALLKLIICSFREEMELGNTLADEVEQTLHNLADIAKTPLPNTNRDHIADDTVEHQKKQMFKALQKAQRNPPQPKIQQFQQPYIQPTYQPYQMQYPQASFSLSIYPTYQQMKYPTLWQQQYAM